VDPKIIQVIDNIVTNLLKALRNSGHGVTKQVTSYNNRASAINTLLGNRQRTNEMPGIL
jgi:signal transduction histidine kinase